MNEIQEIAIFILTMLRFIVKFCVDFLEWKLC
jgi:hypothetical protein